MQRRHDLPVARMRKHFRVCFDGTAVISRPTYQADGMGGGTTTFAPVGTASCLIACDGRPREVLLAGQIQSIVPWTVDMPYDTDCEATDRVQSDGVTYEVVGDPGPVGLYCRATCVRLQS